MSDIVVLGGINMDLVVEVPHIPRPGETVQGGAARKFPGGKGANQAVAAARLGASVSLIGQVGADPFAEELLESLGQAGVGTGSIRQVPALSTGVALISVAADGQNAIVVAPGANMAWDDAACSALDAQVAGCRVLVVNLEVPTAVVRQAMACARRQGARVLLNPAPYRADAEPALADADILVPNQVEAAQCVGQEPEGGTGWDVVGSRLRARGPSVIVLTLAADGALLVTADETTPVPAYAVPVVDTTAAGDAFVGGLAVAVLEGQPLREAVGFANACGALAVTQAGAQPSLPGRSAVDRLRATRR
jgi:ribokinase